MIDGAVTHLFTAPHAGAPMQAHQQTRALQGSGLEGDRYATGTGYYSPRPGTGRHLTLIAQEDLDAANAELDPAQRPLLPHETRRNVVTAGIDLNALIGNEFTIGDVVCVATRPCTPCRYLDELVEREVMHALVHRAGIRAEILGSGTIRIGDRITAAGGAHGAAPTPQSFDSARTDTIGL